MDARTWLLMAIAPIVLLGHPIEPQTQRSPMFVSRQCNENALDLRLDPAPFQDFVGPGFSVALVEGKARVVIVVHDCSQLWIDGKDLGPGQEVRVWVQVQGLNDVRTVVGAEQTVPTQTWFTLFEGSSNARVREAKIAAGTPEADVDSVVLLAPESGQSGRVYLSGNLAFVWHVPSPAASSARLVGLNHDVYRRDSAGGVVFNQIQALMHLSSAPSAGTLDVSSLAGAVPLIKPGTYPVSVRIFFPMWSRATLGLAPPK